MLSVLLFLVKLVFKLIAAPVLLALYVANSAFRIMLAVSESLLGFFAVLLMPMSIFIAVTSSLSGGITCAVLAVAISPFGLPRLAGWLADRVDDLGYLLKEFIFS